MRRIFPECLREDIQGLGFAALDTRASKLFFLEFSESLYTYCVCSVIKEYREHPSLTSQN